MLLPGHAAMILLDYKLRLSEGHFGILRPVSKWTKMLVNILAGVQGKWVTHDGVNGRVCLEYKTSLRVSLSSTMPCTTQFGQN